MKKIFFACLIALCFAFTIFAQIPTTILVNIVKAEDERRFDKTPESLLKKRERTRSDLRRARRRSHRR